MSPRFLNSNCTRSELAARISALRNFGIIAHIDAGKTTCTERILYFAGAQHTSGDVHDGNTTTDYDPDEQKRGITIKAACVSCEWRGHAINLIDTPGHIDFTVEVQRSLAVLDGAVVVFSAVQGVQPQSETVWRQADRFGVPRLCFVNKMDTLGANFPNTVEQIRSRLGGCPLPLQMPLGQELEFCGMIDLVAMRQFRFVRESMGADIVESEIDKQFVDEASARRQQLVASVADADQEIGELFLADQEPDAAQLTAAVRRICLKGVGFPVVCGSAYCYIGIQHLLDAVVAYLPSPLDRCVNGTDPENPERVLERKADVTQPFAGLAFKTLHDNYGALTLMRIYSGILRKGERVLNVRRNESEKVERLYRMQADRAISIAEAGAGQIVAISGLRHTTTGDTLCSEDARILLEAPSFPETVISMAVEAQTNADTARLAVALSKLAKEDPTFTHAFDPETGQLVISGMGELHLDTIRSKLMREYNVSISLGAPRVAYRETLEGFGQAEGRHVKQTGGPGQFGVCSVTVEPFRNEEKDHLVFESAIAGGAVPREYVVAIERGIRNAARNGVLGSGFPMIHVKVRVIDGECHVRDSSTVAFECAGFEAFRLAAAKAKPILLEPVMLLEVVTPDTSMGAIMGDLNSRRVEIHDVGDRGHLKVIRGRAPLSEMFAYSSTSRSLSSGRATFTMEPWDYRPVPRAKYAEVLER